MHKTITGVACSGDGRHVAANYLNDQVYLFSLEGLPEKGPVALPNRATPMHANGKRTACADVSAVCDSPSSAEEDSSSPGKTQELVNAPLLPLGLIF